ncbi:MAG TPA: Spy/CpxP family protein refolding chaperone [Candidatus Tectomicrobia bacterium]
MTRAAYGVAMPFGLLLILSIGTPAHSGMMGHGHMGQSETAAEPSPGGRMGMMGQSGMPRMPEEGRISRPNRLVQMLKAELGLSEEQTKKAKDVLFQVMRANIKGRADLQIAELELQELLDAEAVDIAQVEAKLKGIEGLRTTLRLNMIKAHEQAKALLTPEQRQKFEHLHDHLAGIMGSGMMSMMETLGEGGSGAMGGTGMMRPQMRRGMMGGGMAGQSQHSMPMAGSPQNLTQEDTQGAVTVSATLLTPDKPRADGKLAVQVKLETHTVDLDPYHLETLALLRDAQGREVQAVGLESPSGSGHHREGILIFPSMDASGTLLLGPEAKSLTLLLRGISGVQERSFRWQVPASSRP